MRPIPVKTAYSPNSNTPIKSTPRVPYRKLKVVHIDLSGDVSSIMMVDIPTTKDIPTN